MSGGTHEEPPARPAPLDGVKVVDVTQVLAGPYCTYQLALLGADVVKVEPPGGEWARQGVGPAALTEEGLGLSFCTQNADKRFVELDLKQPAGLEALLGLLDGADVFVQSFRPGVAERLGLGVDVLHARNPRLVHTSISAYGADGPLGGRPAYDHVVQAMSGIMETTGTDDHGPVKVGAPYVDYATGLNAAFAVLAALLERHRTGEGQVVDVAMLDTALLLMASNVTAVATTGADLPKLGNEAASRAASSGCFEAGDARLLMLAANNDRQFTALATAMGHPEWADDVRFASGPARAAHEGELRAEMRAVFATATADRWEERFAAHGVPASRVRRLTEVLAEGQPAARGLLHALPVGSSGVPVHLPAVGFRLNGDPLAPRTPPQPVGADDRTVLHRSEAPSSTS